MTKKEEYFTFSVSWRGVFKSVGVLLLLSALSCGVYTNYYFFWKSTGVTFQESGEELNRAQLIDLVLEQAVAQQQQPQVIVPEAEVEGG